ncbi:hypothetical protein GGI11_002348 [Coemansia sp. RSA 2049]|nr:hypothetical protein GGI11_002348 [Coemansia sp. RSA 2049]
MSMTPQASRKSTGTPRRRSSIGNPKTPRTRTPRGSTKRQREEDTDNVDGGNTWDFDAPKFYDFANSKTPGMTADKWFDSFVPNRPSLSPLSVSSKVDGDLELDIGLEAGSANIEVENVEFSNSDEEKEFRRWKQDHMPPASAKVTTRTAMPRNNLIHDGIFDNTDSIEASQTSTRGQKPSISAGSDVVEADPIKPMRAATKTKPATVRSGLDGHLTVPVELGFMRPTRVVSRRLSVKKREKESKQAIAMAIAKSINRTLADEGSSSLTIPKPFSFNRLAKSNGNGSRTQNAQPQVSATSESELAKQTRGQPPSRHKSAKGAEEQAENKAIDTESPPRRTAKRFKPTVPKTPQFAKTKRIRPENPTANAVYQEKAKVVRLKKPAVLQALNAIRLSPLKPTVVQPFTFQSDAVAERHLLKLRDEIAKLKAEEEALRQFHANPLPEFPTPKKPKHKPSNIHTSPFKLATDIRGEVYQRQLRERLEELETRQRERMLFKAQPIPPSFEHPFVPKQSAIPLTAIEEILLHTELRSEERREYDDERREREHIREEVLERKRLEEEQREEEEIKILRKMLVHKAQPVRRYKPIAIKASDRQPTIPKTPQWCVRTRRQSETPTTPTH